MPVITPDLLQAQIKKMQLNAANRKEDDSLKATQKRRIDLRLDDVEDVDALIATPKNTKPQIIKPGRVAKLRALFEKVLHPYSKVGGNLAGTQANPRPIAKDHLIKHAPKSQAPTSEQYNRGLADMLKALQPKTKTPFNKPLEDFIEAAQKIHANDTANIKAGAYLYIETYSAQLQISSELNKFILKETHQALFVGMTRDQDDKLSVKMSAALFNNELRFDEANGLTKHSMFANAERVFNPKPAMGTSRKLDDMDEMPSFKAGMKSR